MNTDIQWCSMDDLSCHLVSLKEPPALPNIQNFFCHFKGISSAISRRKSKIRPPPLLVHTVYFNRLGVLPPNSPMYGCTLALGNLAHSHPVFHPFMSLPTLHVTNCRQYYITKFQTKSNILFPIPQQRMSKIIIQYRSCKSCVIFNNRI